MQLEFGESAASIRVPLLCTILQYSEEDENGETSKLLEKQLLYNTLWHLSKKISRAISMQAPKNYFDKPNPCSEYPKLNHHKPATGFLITVEMSFYSESATAA